ncbi:hypothetical protein CEXT_633571 [Caerostris extrusa]|uniref:Uncharacterized protein n=1 Tax=Caerostris extrusa TaxID=172846 RepID=A0AAV4PK44_CAEEX|nr:hypothetical protein CEXT_633571 [Caerostris extrusa]
MRRPIRHNGLCDQPIQAAATLSAVRIMRRIKEYYFIMSRNDSSYAVCVSGRRSNTWWTDAVPTAASCQPAAFAIRWLHIFRLVAKGFQRIP